MKKKAVFFHSTFGTVSPVEEVFRNQFPEVQLISLAEDGILPEVIANDGVPTPAIIKRLIGYAGMAQEAGASVFVCVCTTLGMAMRDAQKALSIPLVMIDAAMLRRAVTLGDRIALLITFPPTKQASMAAAREFAKEAGHESAVIDIITVAGAREAILQGDSATHDRLIAAAAHKAALDHDVIAFAQVSMVNAANLCADMTVPVLTSLEPGIAQLEEYFV
ncbi:MAG: aspartate/glutamate racemase family protein [Oscillibacter sp.]|nr:aspartate/glutamate racemase family protein [Oscillibacter sp.]